MHFTDFELLATNPQIVKADGKRLVTFNLQIPGALNEPIPCSYDAVNLRDLNGKLDQAGAAWRDLIALGQALGDILFPAPVRGLFVIRLTQAQSAGTGIRLRLMLSGELNNQPWEYVLVNRAGFEATAQDFLGLTGNVSIVRQPASTLPVWKAEAKQPAQMIVALCSPGDLPELKLADERRVIEQALAGNSRVHAEYVEHASAGNFLGSRRPVHLFHFAGHGQPDKHMGERPGTTEGKGVLMFEDGYGDSAPMDADVLGVQLREAGVRVAVLGACLTSWRDDVHAWSSVTEALLKADLAAVVGMQFAVRDTSAVTFAREFYAALLVGLSMDEAVQKGRLAIMATGDVRGWGTPALYMRAPDGIVFPEFTADPRLDQERTGAILESIQRVKEVQGKLTGIKVGSMGGGTAKSIQQIDTVAPGAQVNGIHIDNLNIYPPSANPPGGEPANQPSSSQPDDIGSDRFNRIYDVLNQYFSRSDLEDICFRLGIDWDNIDGETKQEKSRALIVYVAHLGRLSELLNAIRAARPNLRKLSL